MKKTTFILVFIGILLGCTVTKQYAVNKEVPYMFDDQIQLHILDIKELSQVTVGNGAYYPKKGFKFFEMLVEAKNLSNRAARMNWNQIQVLDTVKKTRYSPGFVMSGSSFNIGGRNSRPLRAKATISKRLIYSIEQSVNTQVFGINDRFESIPHVEIRK